MDKATLEHFESMDGAMKAHMLVLRALLREQPALKTKLNAYAMQLKSNPPANKLSDIQLKSMEAELLAITG